MKIVRLLHPFCIPVFGYIAGGEEIGMPNNIAEAMVAAGYAEYEVGCYLAGVPGLLSVETPLTAAVELPTESPTELHKSKHKNLPVAEDAPAEEN